MSVNTGGADQVEIERLTAKVEKLKAELKRAMGNNAARGDKILNLIDKCNQLKARMNEIVNGYEDEIALLKENAND